MNPRMRKGRIKWIPLHQIEENTLAEVKKEIAAGKLKPSIRNGVEGIRARVRVW
jgi:hypothetical protein